MTAVPTRGDGGVAGRLYETYARGVFTTCLALLGSREDAADAMHEVFAKALPLADSIEHPNAWLQTAARHHCTDLLRRRQLARRRDAPSWASGRPEPDPADVVELRSTAARAWASLSDRERRALAHHVFRGDSVPEVASRMRLSYGATVQLLSRARRRAAQVGQLPSVIAAPSPRLLSGVVRRIVTTPPSGGPVTGGRGVAAGAALLCATTVLCTGGSVPAHVHHAAKAPRPVAGVAARPVPSPWLTAPPLPSSIGLGRLARAAAAATVPLAHRAPAACSGVPPPASSPPIVIWTVPSNDETSLVPGQAPPQLDLIRATLATRGDTLVARIYVQNMSLAMPPGVTTMYWTLVWGSHELDAMARSSGISTDVTYYDIDYMHRSGGGDSGTVVAGPSGYVEIEVPFTHLGIKDGDTLIGVRGTTSMAPLATQTDTAGPGVYTVPSAGC